MPPTYRPRRVNLPVGAQFPYSACRTSQKARPNQELEAIEFELEQGRVSPPPEVAPGSTQRSSQRLVGLHVPYELVRSE